ncbi:MAG: arylsulfotransferase family protein [Alphaproteobacteria bacterium]
MNVESFRKIAATLKRHAPPRAAAGRALFVASLVVLAVSYGIVAQTYQFWPAGLFQRALMGLALAFEETYGEPAALRHSWAVEVDFGEDGVVRHEPEKAWPGHTLFTSLHEPGAVLVDMQGEIVHEWSLEKGALRKKLGLSTDFLTGMAYSDQVRLMPDGSLWMLVRTYDTVSNAGGLVRLDRDSRVTWTYAATTHHDFDLAADGTVYVLTNDTDDVHPDDSPHLGGFAILDYIDVVSAGGKRLERISVLECFLNSPYRDYLKFEAVTPRKYNGDILHSNALRLVGPDDLDLVPGNGHRHALVSIRTFQVVALLDLDAKEVVHVLRGPWIRQHDPDVLPDGSIMLFDNLGGMGSETPSRVIRFSPRTGEILWQWPEPGGRHSLDSYIRGSQHPLPNGNVLITESQGARLIEVTPDGEVAWEYRSTFQYDDDKRYRYVIRSGQRFGSLPWLKNVRGEE